MTFSQVQSKFSRLSLRGTSLVRVELVVISTPAEAPCNAPHTDDVPIEAIRSELIELIEPERSHSHR